MSAEAMRIKIKLQLVMKVDKIDERLNGSQEVIGSIPTSSISKIKDLANMGYVIF